MTAKADLKTCRHCAQTKPTRSFAVTRPGRRGSTCLDCRNAKRRARGESSRRRQGETADERRVRLLWETYRLTDAQYRELLAAQNGACAICFKKPDAEKPLAVDHCHATGVVRALLCNLCNLQIGVYEQTREVAVRYLATYGAGNPFLKT